jgi:diguanylate cyclase (GGDEF)-like protein
MEYREKQELLGIYNATRSRVGRKISARLHAVTPEEHKLLTSVISVATADTFRQERHATIDVLTGLHNRRYFDERFAEEFNYAQRTSMHIGLALGDIRKLRNINTEFGHIGGDRLLRHLGGSIDEGKHMRASDVACRTGGDEIGVLFPNLKSEKRGLQRSEKENLCIATLRMLESVHASPVQLRADASRPIHLDFGVTLSDHHDTQESMYTRADYASYVAKKLFQEGENKIVVATQSRKGIIFESAVMNGDAIIFTKIVQAQNILANRIQ